jgi:hypothetical protein
MKKQKAWYNQEIDWRIGYCLLLLPVMAAKISV